jgi:hypothetical protein
MSISLMTAAWKLAMPASPKLVLLAMCDWANDEGESLHPSIKAIAKRASMSERNAQRVLHGLIENGWLSVVANTLGGRPGTTRHYRLNVSAILSRGADVISKKGGATETGDASVRGDNLSGVTNTAETGDTGVVRRVTNTTETGDTHVTQSIIYPSIIHHKNHQEMRACADAAKRFEEFWAAYPSKVAKPQCLRKWKSAGLDEKADAILANIAARRSGDRRWLEGFIPNPLTYLNQERWNDPIQPVARAGPGAPHTATTSKTWQALQTLEAMKYGPGMDQRRDIERLPEADYLELGAPACG